ncbi:MAG: flagellar hook-basal body complex protein [Desulfobulbaceae bacterium]|uniref:Flagellar hook protein FlgE n=1 Tax=Candidatus Desulfobia pelagia TaxID=2841692 RepID=A0A8J6TET0_9BACT|nr:flagellar hook-basal body complex protein [Candidatus Desulfobia pelagia]
MAISSSLYSSISGLSTMGDAMAVLGDNVANTNTLSFKASRTTFQDVLAQSISTASGSAQVGRGVTMSTVDGLFAQGSFETSSTPTDMAIGGQGFFMLRAAGSAESDMYTRAGEFRFDQEGFLVNPTGHFVQGWAIDQQTEERAGTIGDLRLDTTTPPVETLDVEVIANLDSREDNESVEVRLFESWNGTNAAAVNPTAPINPQLYEYTSSIKVYDAKGASHDIAIYFDRTTQDNQWEFLVTCDPSEDMRTLSAVEQQIYAPDTTYNYEEHAGAGALLYGIIQFDTSGNISAITAYDVPPDGEVNPARSENRVILENTESYYSFDANFTGADVNQQIRLSLGAQYNGSVTDIRQVIVSELGALDSDGAGANYITAETYWRDVYDQSGLQLSGDSTSGDTITISGFAHDGTRVASTYQVNSDEKVQVFLNQLENDFGCSASIDASGRLKMTDLIAGNSGMHVTSVIVDGTIDQPFFGTHDLANPFGATGTNGDTVLNITTPKLKILSQGQGLSAGGSVPVVTANTSWTNVFDASGVAIADGTTFTFVGAKGDGAIVNVPPFLPAGENVFTVSTTVTSTNTGTVSDLLMWLEDTFECDAEIDFAGRLVLTDRIADEAATTGYQSQLAISSLVSSGANPWDDAGVPAPFTPSAGSGFLTLSPNISGEDGSQQGDVISSSFSPEALSSTQYANSSTTIFQDQNGFASGFLQSVSVDTEGVITGNYSNGQVLKKAQVALANFASLAGLHKQGGNVYRETTDSGAPVSGVPGTNGLGTIAPNALEQSNVDLGTEFVKLITVQRAFQANSKIITTTDEMLNDLINIKR